MKRSTLLTMLILLGLTAGAMYGQLVLFSPESRIGDDHWTKLAGDLVLIRPLMLLIVPLVFVSVVVGVTSIGDPSRLGLVGGSTLVYYFSTMFLAAAVGVALVTAIAPGRLSATDQERLIASAGGEVDKGDSAVPGASRDAPSSLGGAWLNIGRQLVPTNLVSEMSQGRTLGIIVFAILLGLSLALGGMATQPAVRLFEALFDALLRLVLWVIWLTPIGVFLLVAWSVGRIGLAALTGPLSWYLLCVFLGLLMHGGLVLPLVLRIVGRADPYRFMWRMRRALLTAFGTSSSIATLPMTIETAIDEAGCSRRAANFVLPLGATVNMDGTALYQGVAVIFLFQLYGVELHLGQMLVVVLTATLAAVGAAGVPAAGLVTMVIIIFAVNTSLSGRADGPLPIEAIGIILGVDRILDMCRTTVNVWGDAVGARIITRLAPDESADG